MFQHVHFSGWRWYREFITFNAEHRHKIRAICCYTYGISKLFIYISIFVQDCRVVIWTKNEVGGGSWTSKVIKTKMCF